MSDLSDNNLFSIGLFYGNGRNSAVLHCRESRIYNTIIWFLDSISTALVWVLLHYVKYVFTVQLCLHKCEYLIEESPCLFNPLQSI